jgi:hypothetical protein
MKRRMKMHVLTVGVTMLCAAPAWAGMSLSPISAFSFQDEPTFQMVDNTALLTDLDGLWAPSPVDGFSIDYYATGHSHRYWDAVSLSFDLSPVEAGHHITSATLRFYAQQGYYVDTLWHHYEVLPGVFNASDEDNHPVPTAWPELVDFGSYGDNGLVGWLSQPIPLSWITGDALNVTLRLWNVRIDKIELDVMSAPLPGAVVLSLLGFGAAGTGLLARRSRRRRPTDT